VLYRCGSEVEQFMFIMVVVKSKPITFVQLRIKKCNEAINYTRRLLKPSAGKSTRVNTWTPCNVACGVSLDKVAAYFNP